MAMYFFTPGSHIKSWEDKVAEWQEGGGVTIYPITGGGVTV
jgi:hypothetical protein